MPIHYAEDVASGTAILTLRGPLSWTDYAAALGPMIALRDRCGTLKVIEVVESFAGFEQELEEQAEVAAATREAQALMEAITHVAIVSDIGWFCPILSASTARGFALRNFALADLDGARAWMLSVCAPPETGGAAFRKDA